MELKQVKENVRKMVSLGAPEEDIDGYIAAAGYTVDDVKNYRPPQYSAADKAKYTLRAAGEGLTLGLGDVAAGLTNTVMSPIAKTAAALTEGTPLTAADFNPVKNFKEGRGDFVREQKDFAKEHAALNTLGELGGGLITGIGGAAKTAGARALRGLGKWGTAAATGAGSGAAYGFGTGLTRDEDTLDPVQGAKEGAQGAFLGGIFGLAAPAAFNLGGRLANRLNKHRRAYRQLSKAAKGRLEESIESGVPLIDTADKKALRLIEGAYQADDEASEILSKYADGRMAALQEEAEGTLDKMFGKKGFDTLLKERREYANKLAEPLYAKAFAKGRVNIQLDPMQRLMAQELRQNPYSAYALRNLADNDFRFLDAVKRGLDYKISAIEEAMKKRTAKAADAESLPSLKQSRTRLLETLDKASPHYRLARSVAEQGIKFEEGAQAGQRAFLDPAAGIEYNMSQMGRGGRKPDWEGLRQKARALKAPGAAERQLAQINLLEDIYNAAAQAERSGYKAGAGQALRKLLEGSGANWENYYQKLFNRNRLNKLRAMGIDTGKFMPEIERGKKTAGNMRNLFRGSQTAEREQDKAFFKPAEFLKKKAAAIISKAWVISPQDIARMSIDPGYAALMRQAAAQLPKAAYTDISGAGGAFANIAGPLVKKGESPIAVNRNSWTEIKKSPDPYTYDAIPYIRDIHAKGRSLKGVPNYKQRGDDFTSWDYYQHREPSPDGEKEMLISVGNAPEYRELHNINPDVEEFMAKKKLLSTHILSAFHRGAYRPPNRAVSSGRNEASLNSIAGKEGLVKGQKKDPWFSGKSGPDMPRTQRDGIFRNTPPLLNSITQNMGNVKPVSMRDFMRVLLSPQFGGIAAQVGEGADKKASAFTPRHKLGNAEDINSIANKQGKIKGKKNNYRSMKDLLILLQRPWTLGLQGNIARENTEDK